MDTSTQGHVRALIKYAKVWKRTQSVPLKSIILESAAIAFVSRWQFLQESLSYSVGGPTWWHDWMVRDYFAFLLRHDHLNLPYGEVIHFGEGWKRKTMDALNEADKACYYEKNDQCFMAETHWCKIFGSQFPRISSNPSRGLASRRTLLAGLVDG